MKYLQQGGFQHKAPMRLTLGLSLAMLAGLWLTGFAMYFQRMGLSPASVRDYYLGSPDGFSNPRSYASMLETAHAHLPMMALVLLLLTHLVIFAPFSDRAKARIAWLAFGSAILEESSGWLVRFVDPAFAPLRVAAFLLFQGVLGGLIAGLALFLFRAARDDKPHPHHHRRAHH
ncbi:MAG: hypothetical protein HYZ75_19565 [Elusimicrobia bacterium]|nr:hypothetical protein [Elusimicrobiota bacterium]